MLRIVPRSAVIANRASCRTASKMITLTVVKTGAWNGSERFGSRSWNVTRSGIWVLWMRMPFTTALMSSLEV